MAKKQREYWCFQCKNTIIDLNGGVIFTSSGNYGSQVIDRVGESGKLFIVICDVCLLQHHKMIYDANGKRFKKWKPDFINKTRKEMLRIFQNEDGSWTSEISCEGGRRTFATFADAASAISHELRRESDMSAKGFPLGEKKKQ